MYKIKKKQPLKESKKTSSSNFSITEKELRKLFEKTGDVFFNPGVYRPTSPIKITLVGCEGMIDTELLNALVFERLNLFFERYPEGDLTKEQISESLYLPQLVEIEKKETIFADIFSGKLLIFFHDYQFLYSINIAKRPQRNPEETATEVTVKGPRDNFIEDASVNIALIRKRLRTNSLHIKNFEVGSRTLTKVSVLYMDEVANMDMVESLAKEIEAIDVDGIYSGNQLMELIEKSSPFIPRHHYTGRPDFAVQCLLKGRIIIIIDGVAYANITPINILFLLKTSEDVEYTNAFTSFERIIRLSGILMATFLPGFWVALTTFHPDQIPLILLATIVEARRGLPLPTALEAIIMLLLFELFKEAGMRMPSAIGTTLSVLGGLIIGDAAIRSGLTSPAMLVVIAGSSIATFTLVNQSLIGVISLFRLACILLSSFFGLFGFLFMVHFYIIFIANIRILGTPFLDITANLNIKNILKGLFRVPSKLDNKRFQSFFSKDPTKQRSDGSQ
ncbi:spore germination protein [Peribacillus asahii]|uniref:spore germination protein n=1 Tax=Peribacillus asahii TaxID=228899 RepID=UPI00381B6993